jgi:hypothetical protein
MDKNVYVLLIVDGRREIAVPVAAANAERVAKCEIGESAEELVLSDVLNIRGAPHAPEN